MTDPKIEAAARAMVNAPGEDGRCAPYYYKNLAHAAITAIEPMIRAQVEREIVAYLDQLDAERRETNLLAWAARKIEAGEYRK